MHNTISQLNSEFSEDIIKIDGTPEENCRNPELLDKIEDQLQSLCMKISELLKTIENKKTHKILKPNDEIK
jgi:predicted nuclease with TOPRIM domain